MKNNVHNNVFISVWWSETKGGVFVISTQESDPLHHIPKPTTKQESCLKIFFCEGLPHLILTFETFVCLLPCLCWCIAAFISTLLPPTANHFNRVTAGQYFTSYSITSTFFFPQQCACAHKMLSTISTANVSNSNSNHVFELWVQSMGAAEVAEETMSDKIRHMNQRRLSVRQTLEHWFHCVQCFTNGTGHNFSCTLTVLHSSYCPHGRQCYCCCCIYMLGGGMWGPEDMG